MLRGVLCPRMRGIPTLKNRENAQDGAPDTTAVQDVVVLTRALEVDAHRASICMSVGSVGSNRDGVVLENVCEQFAENLRR